MDDISYNSNVNPYPVLDEFFRRRPARSYRKQTIIFDAEDPVAGLFYIVSGRVKLATANSNRELILFTLGPSEIFPLGAYFLPTRPATAYTAMSEVKAIWRPQQEVDEFLDRHPAALREVVAFVLMAFYTRVQDLSTRTSMQRVLYRLMYLAARFGQPAGPVGIELKFTQQELADSLNLTRESVSLILNRLQTMGVVQLGRSKIYLEPDKANTLLAHHED